MDRIQKLVQAATEEAARGVKRKADQISVLDKQSEALRKQLSDTEKAKRKENRERSQFQHILNIHQIGPQVWNVLDAANKWKKTTLLAVFSTSRNIGLPTDLEERVWKVKKEASKFRLDADILLARLSSPLTQKDFDDYYLRDARYDYDGGVSDDDLPRFTLPAGFQLHKDIVIAALKRYPELLKQNALPDHLLDSRDVFLAFCSSNRHEKPHIVGAGCTKNSLPQLLSKFSSRIRGNARLMLTAARCFKTNLILENITEKLGSDLPFARKLLSTYEGNEIPAEDFLQKFAFFVRSNRDLVQDLVEKNGRCLRHASPSLREDVAVAKPACQNNATAITFTSNSTLYKSKSFVLDVLDRWPGGDDSEPISGDPKIFKKLHRKLQSDKDIIVAAHGKGNMSFKDVPARYMNNTDFCMTLIQKDPSIWFELKERFRESIDFAKALQCFHREIKDGDSVRRIPLSHLAREIMENFPVLRDDHSTWSKVISSAQYYDEEEYDLIGILRSFAPAPILADVELMEQSCKHNYEVLLLIGDDLVHNRDLLGGAVQCSGYALQVIPHSAQKMYPDLVCDAIRDIDELYDDEYVMVARDLWGNLNVAESWFEQGGGIHDRFPEYLKNDERFALLVAQHARERIHFEEEPYGEDFEVLFFTAGTSPALRDDKAFMTKAVNICSQVFFNAGPNLRRNVDIASVAFGKEIIQERGLHMDWLEYVSLEGSHDDEVLGFLHRVHQHAKDKVQAYDGFTKGLLPGFLPREGKTSVVSTLSIGVETSRVFRKTIASYLGVPDGSEVPTFRRVVENLADLPSLPCTCRPCGNNCRCTRKCWYDYADY